MPYLDSAFDVTNVISQICFGKDVNNYFCECQMKRKKVIWKTRWSLRLQKYEDIKLNKNKKCKI